MTNSQPDRPVQYHWQQLPCGTVECVTDSDFRKYADKMEDYAASLESTLASCCDLTNSYIRNIQPAAQEVNVTKQAIDLLGLLASELKLSRDYWRDMQKTPKTKAEG